MSKYSQEQIVNYLKQYGFIFANSEIYGGLANAWDFGPLGVLLKQNIKKIWWREFITKNPRAVGLDSTILSNKDIWQASGHLTNFSDPLIECKQCHNRFRADKLILNKINNVQINENTPFDKLLDVIYQFHITCPTCNAFNWSEIKQFNLMLKTHHGVVENDNNTIYLRPETAQEIFINFQNIQRSTRLKLPFSVGQIGKSFRNEVTPGNFIFRTREFEQMEIECFCHKNKANEIFDTEFNKIKQFLFETLQFNKNNVQFNEIDKNKLAHYSIRTIDIEYKFPHGWSELWGIANRADYDLKTHSRHAKIDLAYLDPTINQKIIPYVIEPSVGVERLIYALICDKYEIQQIDTNETREILHIPYEIAPYRVAVLPLTNKLNEEAFKIFEKLISFGISTTFDTSGSIGKRYRRQDAIGTPNCVTIDFDSEKTKTATIRDRETMKQIRVKIDDLINFFK